MVLMEEVKKQNLKRVKKERIKKEKLKKGNKIEILLYININILNKIK